MTSKRLTSIDQNEVRALRNQTHDCDCPTHRHQSRREMLRHSAMMGGLAAAYATLPGWMPRMAFAPKYQNPAGDVLVSVFLRGGADMLNIIVPHGEDAYYAARPQLAIPRPDASGVDARAIDLDGFFGLHPAMGALQPIFAGGGLTAVHATGSPHETRSHFEAMDYMERGTPGSLGINSGWIGRHLQTLQNGNNSPVRAIGWGVAVQQALRGTVSPVALQSIIDYHLGGDEQFAAQMLQSINSLYTLEGDALYASAQATYSAIDTLAQIDYASYAPRNGAVYPESDFALALRQTAALIRAEVGLEAVCIDLGGWDTHINQGGAEGVQARLMTQLAEGLAAFHTDMGTDMAQTTVTVMSEFGRRVNENGGSGTDHGHGGGMLVMSGNLATVPVVADWPGLQSDALDRGEDLAVTIDYRNVLGDILLNRLHNNTLTDIFPDYQYNPVGLFAGRA